MLIEKCIQLNFEKKTKKVTFFRKNQKLILICSFPFWEKLKKGERHSLCDKLFFNIGIQPKLTIQCIKI